MRETKLCQVVALEKPLKARVEREVTDIHKALQKKDLCEGFSKTYSPLKEDGEWLMPESKVIQVRAEEAFGSAVKALESLWDISATRDFANCEAKADIVVDGEVLVKGAPTTFLLFLEKQLNDLHTFVGSLPELDTSEVWTRDENQGVYRTEAKKTAKTKKMSKALVMYPATPQHPAQTQLVQEDEVVGYWEHTRVSAAVPTPWKKRLLERVERVQSAVKMAREEANMITAHGMRVGQLLAWIVR